MYHYPLCNTLRGRSPTLSSHHQTEQLFSGSSTPIIRLIAIPRTEIRIGFEGDAPQSFLYIHSSSYRLMPSESDSYSYFPSPMASSYILATSLKLGSKKGEESLFISKFG